MTDQLFEVENLVSGAKYGPYQAKSGVEAIELAATSANEGQRHIAKPAPPSRNGEWRAICLVERNGKMERRIASETDAVALQSLGLQERIGISLNRMIRA
jgi:hypothetical protein